MSVSDTGVGIPAGKMDQIFDSFFTTKAGVLGWDCRSAARSSRRTGDGCGRRTTTVEARPSISLFLLKPARRPLRIHEFNREITKNPSIKHSD